MIRAVLADDSAFLRDVLKEVLEETKKVKVVGVARNGKEAITVVKATKPDVLVLDCEMPVMNGLEALRNIMSECPLPIFMFSSLTRQGSSVTMKALQYGAIDFLLKPEKGAHGLKDMSDQLIKKISMVVVRGKYRFSKEEMNKNASVIKAAQEKSSKDLIKIQKRNIDLIAIGSSTGGVQAAVEIVKNLPEKTKPIVWVQHMPSSFTNSFAERLNSLSKITVKEAVDGDLVKDNHCYIGRGGVQMRIEKRAAGQQYIIKAQGEEKVSGHCPSCNVLFDSVAKYFSNNCLGVILTGMGDDGAKGLVEMHKKGSFVIGQNEQSCVVYGMPKSAFRLGAVDLELDIKDISKAIVKIGGAR